MLQQECGTLDVLVNNAGIGHACALLDTPLDLVRSHMETNYVGAVRMIQLVSASHDCYSLYHGCW
jgi:NAD(P)-dependent dehydrogenase (short-subunit alcohol dehydrogenase family)